MEEEHGDPPKMAVHPDLAKNQPTDAENPLMDAKNPPVVAKNPPTVGPAETPFNGTTGRSRGREMAAVGRRVAG